MADSSLLKCIEYNIIFNNLSQEELNGNHIWLASR